jgi:soluble lytic murein transglycosylase-like protein
MKMVAYILFTLFFFTAMAETKPVRWITDAERAKVYAIGKANGVPLSVVRQLMYEESRGNVLAVSDMTPEGFYSRGLFQIYTKPGNVEWLLWKFWTKSDGEFDIDDPIANATLALRYLSWLHKRFGNWYQACVYYNHGSVKGYSEGTRTYALRIINAP